MAIVGTFEADFSQFTSAVRGAETQLRSLEGNSTKVVSSIDRVGGQLAGLAGAFGIAFSAGAVINFGRELVRTADELTKLHDRTGLSVRALQQFQVAGDDAGNTVNELAAAVVQMQNRIAGGDKSAVQALTKLGVELSEIRRLSPEDQFIAISDALRQIEDPADQVNIAMALFGRTGATVLPTLKRGFDDVKDSVVGMSAETVATLDAIGDALTKFRRDFTIAAGESITFAIAPWKALVGLFDDGTKQLAAVSAEAERAAPKMAGVAPPGLPDDLREIERELTANAEALIKVGLEAEKAESKLKELQELARNRTLELLPMEPTDVNITPENFQPTGAFKTHLDEAAAAREHAEALALVEQQMTENFLIVGQTSAANAEAGAAATAATDAMMQGYAGVASQVTVTGDAIREWIRLMEYSAKVNAILYENTLFTGLGQRKEIARLSEGGLNFGGTGGGSGVVNHITVNAGNSFYDTPESVQQLATKVGDALVARQRAIGATT